MATLLSRSSCAKILVFRKKWHFLLQNVFISDFLARIRNQRLRIDPCAKFQLHWTKDKGTRHTYLLVMTSTKFLWLLRDFVPEYHHAKFGCNWTTNKGETEGRRGVPKNLSLNRVNPYQMLKNPCCKWSLTLSRLGGGGGFGPLGDFPL